MAGSRRWSLWVVALSLLCAGCSSTIGSSSARRRSVGAPVALGRGVLAVIRPPRSQRARVWIFPPHSDRFTREITFPGSSSYRTRWRSTGAATSISASTTHRAAVNTRSSRSNVQSLDLVRENPRPPAVAGSVGRRRRRELPLHQHEVFDRRQHSRFIGRIRGDKQAIEIKAHHTPLTILVASRRTLGWFSGRV